MNFVTDLDVKGKLVFLRVDFNVPLDESGAIRDDNRIKASLPTIQWLLEHGARLVIASHLGRPKGKPDPKMSLAPAAKRLAELIPYKVVMAPDVVGDDVARLKKGLGEGEALVLENVRFYKEEEKNDPVFSQALARLAEVYVNDAFAVSHRAHASVEGITKFFREKAAGFLMKEELTYLHKVMVNPARPLAAVIGGAKVSGKLEVLKNLTPQVNIMLIGGGMAFTFLKATGYEVGKSLVEDELLATAREILEIGRQSGVKVLLPVDCVVAEKFEAAARNKVVGVKEIPKDWMGLDIGPATAKQFADALRGAKTIIWNGPMGVFEMAPYSKGTMEIARAVAESGAVSVVGGGDTDLAVHRSGQAEKISYISTAGGAFLELLEGKALPGVEALKK